MINYHHCLLYAIASDFYKYRKITNDIKKVEKIFGKKCIILNLLFILNCDDNKTLLLLY